MDSTYKPYRPSGQTNKLCRNFRQLLDKIYEHYQPIVQLSATCRGAYATNILSQSQVYVSYLFLITYSFKDKIHFVSAFGQNKMCCNLCRVVSWLAALFILRRVGILSVVLLFVYCRYCGLLGLHTTHKYTHVPNVYKNISMSVIVLHLQSIRI